MKIKRHLKTFLLLFISLFIFVGCTSNKVSEKDVSDNLLSNGISIYNNTEKLFNDDQLVSVTSIEKLNILTRKYNKRTKEEALNVDIEFTNNITSLKGNFDINYSLYDKGGWRIDNITANSYKIVSVQSPIKDDLLADLNLDENNEFEITEIGQPYEAQGTNEVFFYCDIKGILTSKMSNTISKTEMQYSMKLNLIPDETKGNYKWELDPLKNEKINELGESYTNEFNISLEKLKSDLSNSTFDLRAIGVRLTSVNINSDKDIVSIDWDGNFDRESEDYVVLSDFNITFSDNFNYNQKDVPDFDGYIDAIPRTLKTYQFSYSFDKELGEWLPTKEFKLYDEERYNEEF